MKNKENKNEYIKRKITGRLHYGYRIFSEALKRNIKLNTKTHQAEIFNQESNPYFGKLSFIFWKFKNMRLSNLKIKSILPHNKNVTISDLSFEYRIQSSNTASYNP